MIDLCGFWMPCSLSPLPLVSPPLAPSPSRRWSCWGSWCRPGSSCASVRSALKASPSPPTTRSSSCRTYTNSRPARRPGPAPPSSRPGLGTPGRGWSSPPASHPQPAPPPAPPRPALGSAPWPGCRAPPGCWRPAAACWAGF